MKPQDMLKKEYEYFQEHKKELCKEHPGKFVVIHDGNVAGVFDDENAAYIEATSKFELGTFLIQACVENDEVQMFHSRVIFS